MPDTITEQVILPARGGSAPAPASGGGLTGADLARILRQRIPLILFVWFFSIALTIGGTALWIKYWPGYRATGGIQLVSINPQPLLEKGADPLREELMERLLQDQTVLLRNYEVLNAVLLDAAVQETSWFRSYRNDVDAALLDLEEDLSCVVRRGTSYVEVSMMCRDPGDPKVIVDTVLRKYHAEAGERAEARYREELAAMTQNLASLQSELTTKRLDRRNFLSGQMAAAGVPWGDNVVSERYRFLGYQQSLAAQEERAARSAYNYYAAGQPQDIAVSPQMQQFIEETPAVASLQQRVFLIDEDLKVSAQEGYLPNHRGIASLQARAAVAEERLDALRQEKLAELQRYEVEQAKIRWLLAEDTLTQIQDQYLEAEAAQRDLDTKLTIYQDMLTEEEELRRYFEEQTRYRHNLDVAMRGGETFRVERIPATPPKQRSQPRWGLNLLAGSALGLALALGLAVMLEFVDTSVRTGRDLVRHANLPVLATVPDLDDEEVAIDDIMRAVRDAPTSMVAEAFRSLRTNLQLSAPAERQRTVMVTSSKPADGKTAVAVNLAVSVASNNRRVLLIDANFRRPAVHDAFSVSAKQGLSDILSGQSTLEAMVVPSGVERLDLICCGRVPPNPAERLGSPEMSALITEAIQKHEYDQVIVDAPPLLLVSDALVVANVVDGVILVCRARANARGVVHRARERLDDVNARVIGAVLNAARIRRGGYFREQFREFYDYQVEPPGMAGPVEPPRASADEDEKPEPS